MGTVATLETYSAVRADGLALLERFVRVLERTEDRLSTWRSDSLLSRLNRQPVDTAFEAEAALCDLVGALFEWKARTDGAFDPAVGSLIEVWGLHDGGRIPAFEELRTARENSGLDHLQLDSGEAGCTLRRRAEVRMDAGAFGKGEALDRMNALAGPRSGPGVDREGVDSWMINLGGQVMVRGRPPGADGWEVSLAHPRMRDRGVRILRMTRGSLATSGGSEHDVEPDGVRLGHVLDPRSGRTVVADHTAVVWHPQALAADILSTALYVMGVEDGLAWAEKNGIAAGYLIPRGGAVEFRSSTQFRETFPETRNE